MSSTACCVVIILELLTIVFVDSSSLDENKIFLRARASCKESCASNDS